MIEDTNQRLIQTSPNVKCGLAKLGSQNWMRIIPLHDEFFIDDADKLYDQQH